MKQTLIINLFGNQVSDKATAAAYLFSRLKMIGADVEYITDYNKYIEDDMSNHLFRMVGDLSCSVRDLFGKVDIIINEYPIINYCLYTDRKYIRSAIVEEFMSYGDNNLNIFLKGLPDNENEESLGVSKHIKDLLFLVDIISEHDEIPHMEITADLDGCNSLIELIVRILGYMNVEEC